MVQPSARFCCLLAAAALLPDAVTAFGGADSCPLDRFFPGGCNSCARVQRAGMTISYSNFQAEGSVATHSCEREGEVFLGVPIAVCSETGDWVGGPTTPCFAHEPIFPTQEREALLTPAMDAQLKAWLTERGIGGAGTGGWALCYSSMKAFGRYGINSHQKGTPAEWHMRCDKHKHTVAIARNGLGFTFGGYSPTPWGSGSSCNRDGSGHFIFRLGAEGLGPDVFDRMCTEQWCPKTSSKCFQMNRADMWPTWGSNPYDLSFGKGELGNFGYCRQGSHYNGWPSQACGGDSRDSVK